MEELGRIEPVEVRAIWKHEASHFTPWLANNLDLLGKALEMHLEVVQTEAAVGDFSLDILARDHRTGNLVAIENQLDRTDHTHLGQILTYAAGHDARAVIWVTPRLREEHRAAIDWLNRWTPEEIGFWGVEVRAIKIGDSLPAPEFRPVAFPNDWAKEAKQKAGVRSFGEERLLQFFTPLSEQLVREGFADKVTKERGIPRYFPTRFTGIGYLGHLSDFVRAYLWVYLENGEAKHRLFDKLETEKAQLEQEVDAEWYWERNGDQRYGRLGVRTEGSIDDPPEKLEQHKAWLLKYLPKLKAALDPRLERIMAENSA